jgi:hypothetical protein
MGLVLAGACVSSATSIGSRDWDGGGFSICAGDLRSVTGVGEPLRISFMEVSLLSRPKTGAVWSIVRDELGENDAFCICGAMNGRGTSRGLSNDACRLENDVLRWISAGRSDASEPEVRG